MRTDFRTTGQILERCIEGTLEIEIRQNAITGVISNWYIVRTPFGDIVCRTAEYGEAYEAYLKLIHNRSNNDTDDI